MTKTSPREWKKRTAASASLLAFACGLVIVLYLFDPSTSGFYPLCVFHRVTGLLCPGCGCLRALHQLLHGNFVASLHFNAMFVLSLPILAWIGLSEVTRRTWGSKVEFALHPVWLWTGLGLIVVFTVLRNLPWGRALGIGM